MVKDPLHRLLGVSRQVLAVDDQKTIPEDIQVALGLLMIEAVIEALHQALPMRVRPADRVLEVERKERVGRKVPQDRHPVGPAQGIEMRHCPRHRFAGQHDDARIRVIGSDPCRQAGTVGHVEIAGTGIQIVLAGGQVPEMGVIPVGAIRLEQREIVDCPFRSGVNFRMHGHEFVKDRGAAPHRSGDEDIGAVDVLTAVHVVSAAPAL